MILAIGPTTQENKVVNGQSMMFQLVIDYFKEHRIDFKLIDIGRSKFSSRESVSGKFSIARMFDYVFLITRTFLILLFSKISSLYLTTSQSRVGFIRDWFFINLANYFGIKIILHQYGSNYSNFWNSQTSNWQSRIRKTLSKANIILVEGQQTKDQFSFLKDYETKVEVIPNGLPEKKLKIPEENLRVDDGPVKLFYLSNLIESKGYLDVLKAFELLKNKFRKDVQIVFAGKFLEAVDDVTFKNQTEAQNYFNDFIREHGLESSVTWFTGLYGSDKAEYFSKSHFFLLPSYYINEGQPVSVLEAMAYGCVPVVTAYRLIPNMVSEENGIIVAPKSPDEMALKIKEVIEKPEVYDQLSTKNKSIFKEKFTPEIFCKKVIDRIQV